jgi:hypothetical protein
MSLYQRWIEMLVKWCEAGQKEHAWHTAKKLEEIWCLEGISAELTRTMRQRLHAVSIEIGGKSDPQPLRKEAR